jgi:cold shock CspA family protein/ribosome-associated translation inhibitor RaiA
VPGFSTRSGALHDVEGFIDGGDIMVIPLEVTFQNLAHSNAIEADVRERVDKLGRFHSHILSCRVVIEAQHRQPATSGSVYHVRVEASVPGALIAAHDEVQQRRFQEDIYVAIRDAFDRARRELEDVGRRQRWYVKTHEEQPRGRVTKLFPDRGYGFLETPDGLEVYFHKNSVLHHGFEKLAVGSEVRFVEEEGERGPQASTVIAA